VRAHHYWTVEEDLELFRLRCKGLSLSAVEREMGRRGAGPRQEKLRRDGYWGSEEKIRAMPRQTLWTEEEDERLAELKAAKYTVKEIHERMPHRSLGAIAERIKSQRSRKKGSRVCIAIGCAAILHHTNKNGLCSDHLHMPGVCRCRSCIKEKQFYVGRDFYDVPPIDHEAFLADVRRRRTDPREIAWHQEIRRGYEFMRRTGKDHVR